ncbi:alpha/beta fold hydrolase [Mycobacterium sp. B14F4]|uniref:alpha/beta fold hydrolase n=1 Tax=Mycobacterium sp. B14F4 TaxID=3153565 RepID=UPI00325C8801
MTTAVSSSGLLERVLLEVERNALRARNGIRMAAGLSRPKVGATPKDVVWRCGRSELWHYRNDEVRFSPPLLIVFSLFSRSYILDLQSGNSFVERLLAAGFDVYLLDWGVPDERDAANQLEDYVHDYLPAAVERVRRLAGTDHVNLLGYCFGGVLSLLYAAHHLDAPLRSLSVMATPVDMQHLGPLTGVIGRDGLDVETMLDADGNLPPQIIRQAFQVLKPTAQMTQLVDLWDRMWGEDYVAAHQAMAGWAGDHVPLPGGVAKQLAQMVQDNPLVNDTLVLGGDRVTLSAITVPFLNVLAARDHIVPEASAAPLIELVGSPDKHEVRLDAGHVGLLVGRAAAKTTPEIVEFLTRRSEIPQ